ncbi:hypothetical protein [Serpentinicella alkaliphila]|uniref:Uncharacterized protein n=1 Tax=Serpentinicella alkaliphila TaxID=1734049 RepID=A0A4R2T6E2_9FIRM|nr:hypothetical protein [Serpentinicella alkaliphila]QUH25864.1 hypothetical protein HZR23_09030 [Serpentinicella alkaliphila]TCP97181.1 hypothetical protein EDD79_10477 [Serpentinicella alkaliphila]
MENKKNTCFAEDLSLHNRDLDVDSNEEKKKKELDKDEVIFHSERINEIVGDLGDMI